MSDKELLKIVTEFTKGIIGNGSSENKCFMVCSPLHTYLNMFGGNVQMVSGSLNINGRIQQHNWLKLKDGRIIDPTADQFNAALKKEMPRIYFGKKPSYYKTV